MKKRYGIVFGGLFLMAAGCEFSRSAPVLSAPVVDATADVKAEEVPVDAESSPSPMVPTGADDLETPPSETPPSEMPPPEALPPEPDPSELVPPETPVPVTTERATAIGVHQGETSFRPLLPSGPTLGKSCGEGASITGDNRAGRVTLGAGASNYCKITFGASRPFVAPPVCTASPASAECGGSVTVGAITADGVFLLAGDGTVNFEESCTVNYICVASE